MNILLVNWQDLRNPHAGGAEIHLFELFSRLAARGHRVRLVCSGFEGAPVVEMVDGIEVHRHGDRHSFALVGRGAVRRALRSEPADVLVDDVNKLPLFTATLTALPIYTLVPHLFGTTAFQEVSWPMAAMVWLAERPIPWLYRRAWFHAIFGLHPGRPGGPWCASGTHRRGLSRRGLGAVHAGAVGGEEPAPALRLCRADQAVQGRRVVAAGPGRGPAPSARPLARHRGEWRRPSAPRGPRPDPRTRRCRPIPWLRR
ncbi:MAG: glycosyltransferase [Gemmatimonadetes bacterium]|nr:glycosyltransferase [Gemmatimonadota bacterium]